MINHQERISVVFETELNRIKLTDTITGFAVNGPGIVQHPQGVAVGWTIMATLKHSKLLGKDDIGVSMPIYGVLPPDDIFRQGAQFLVEEMRKQRTLEEEIKPEETAVLDGALEGKVMPRANELPPGLQGLKLGGLANPHG
jgi:hypothetical protein